MPMATVAGLQRKPARKSLKTRARPNAETLEAMREAERIARDPSVQGYTDLDLLFFDLRR